MNCRLPVRRCRSRPRVVWEPRAVPAPLEVPGRSETLVATAKVLLELLDQQGGRSGKYNVTVTRSQSVQIGDYGTQTNAFTP